MTDKESSAGDPAPRAAGPELSDIEHPMQHARPDAAPAQPTPMTDAHLEIFDGSGRYGNNEWLIAADAEFTSQLERELAQSQAALKKVINISEGHFARIVDLESAAMKAWGSMTKLYDGYNRGLILGTCIGLWALGVYVLATWRHLT